MTRYYVGIGSRRTPWGVALLMATAAHALAADGWVLRSGGAAGADQAWELGAGGRAEIYLPEPPRAGAREAWGTVHDRPTPEAHELAAAHHPAWGRCSPRARALHARNTHIVLGPDLRSPVAWVACWTPDGALDGRGPDSGGTGQALRIATAYGIEVINLGRRDHQARLSRWLTTRSPGEVA